MKERTSRTWQRKGITVMVPPRLLPKWGASHQRVNQPLRPRPLLLNLVPSLSRRNSQRNARQQVSRRPYLYPLRPNPAFLRRSEEHTSELQSLMRISYAVFCLQKKKQEQIKHADIADNRKTNY